MTNEEQPAPVANDKPAVWPLVIADMQARDQLGRERYGVPLQPHNGRSALRDAYEEVLDLAAYLKQVMLESGDTLGRAVELAAKVQWLEAQNERLRAGMAVVERQRDAALAGVHDMEWQRDEAQAGVAEACSQRDAAQEELERVALERDEARQMLRKLEGR